MELPSKNKNNFFSQHGTSFEILNLVSLDCYKTIHSNYPLLLRLTYIKNLSIHTNPDTVYLNVCKNVLENGETRDDRTGTGTVALFGCQMKFDIKKIIPLLTTKRVPWKSCIEELLWFLQGKTDAIVLNDKACKIWNGNSSRQFLDKIGLHKLEEGDCGANYSFQWRHFGAEYEDCKTDYENQGIDQIAYVENLLKNDKYSRRIFFTAWNPDDLKKTVLPPCHVSAQFYVSNDNVLSCHMYQRSCDMFLGVPWNILSYSILTKILRNGLKPGYLTVSTGDTHIYNDHIQQVKQQMERTILTHPELEIDKSIIHKKWNEITINDFKIIGYFPHPSIKATMSVYNYFNFLAEGSIIVGSQNFGIHK